MKEVVYFRVENNAIYFFMEASKQQYFYLARVRLSSVYKGELRVSLPFEWPASLSSPSHVYVYQHHTYVPYQVEGWRVAGRMLFLSLSHLDLLDPKRHAEKGYDLFVLWSWLREALQGSFSLSDLMFCRDFKVVDRERGDLGVVVGVQERTLQPLLIVEGEGGEEEIPVHEKFIHAVDLERREVEVSWPEG